MIPEFTLCSDRDNWNDTRIDHFSPVGGVIDQASVAFADDLFKKQTQLFDYYY